MNSNLAATKTRRATGAMFFAFYGSGWLVWWCIESFGMSLLILSTIAVVGLAIGLTAFRQYRNNKWSLVGAENSRDTKKTERIFNLVNAAQGVSIFVAVLILANTGHPEWIRVAIILIVGIHFLPLAALFRNRWHYASGGALILLAVLYPFLTKAGPLNPVGLFGAGMILWMSAVISLRRISLLGARGPTADQGVSAQFDAAPAAGSKLS